jgi:hypothetical protein
LQPGTRNKSEHDGSFVCCIPGRTIIARRKKQPDTDKNFLFDRKNNFQLLKKHFSPMSSF